MFGEQRLTMIFASLNTNDKDFNYLIMLLRLIETFQSYVISVDCCGDVLLAKRWTRKRAFLLEEGTRCLECAARGRSGLTRLVETITSYDHPQDSRFIHCQPNKVTRKNG